MLGILASAGPGEGRGHLARALALAEAADGMGIATSIALARGEPSPGEEARARAAGSTFTARAALLGGGGALVVDLPDPNEAGTTPLARATAFDDRQVLSSPARIVVQPSLPAWTPAPGGRAGRTLAGYAFAPLGRSVLRAAAERRARHDRATPRVLLCFGGSDPDDVTARLGPPLAADERWTLEIVIGPDYRGAAGRLGLSVTRDPADLARRLAAVDVAVLGAGTLKFEAAALGVPAILVAVADDQLPVGAPFAATGAADWAGDGRMLDPAGLRAAVAVLVSDPARRARMSATGRVVVGSDGARRIIEATVGRRQPHEAIP